MPMASSKRPNGLGSVYYIASRSMWAAAFVHPGTGKRKVLYAKSQLEAESKLTDVLMSVGQYVADPDETTTEQWLTLWLKAKRGTISDRTFVTYESLVRNHVVPRLGRIKLSKLKHGNINWMVDDMEQAGLSAKTRIEARNIVKAALQSAVDQGVLRTNVARLSKAPRRERPDIRPLVQADVPKLMKALNTGSSPDRAALFLLILGTGLRRSEALGLRWEDVDVENRLLYVRNQLVRREGEWVLAELKTHRSRRTISVHATILQSLRTVRARQQDRQAIARGRGDDLGLVFTTSTGSPVDPDNVLRSLKGALRRAGLADTTVHGLRHSAATILLSEGVDLRTIQEILGHSDFNMTANIYAHVLPAGLGRAAERMDAVLTLGTPDSGPLDERDAAD